MKEQSFERTKDRYRRLLGALNRIIPYDAAALLRLEGDVLVPVAAQGQRLWLIRRNWVVILIAGIAL